jgi:hypothetical protein
VIRCGYCRTELPDEALFCGECGRSIAGRIDDEPVLHDGDGREADAGDVPVPVPEHEEQGACASCGATLQRGDIFCGECGDVVRPKGLHAAEHPDTAVIEPLPAWRTQSDRPGPRVPKIAFRDGAAPVAAEPGVAEPEVVEPGVAEPEVAAHAEPDLLAPELAVPGLPAAVPRPTPGFIAPFMPREPMSAPSSERAPTLAERLSEILDDVEDTRIVARVGAGEKFVLQFSTGESVRVSGSGLIGRNPRSEPAEFVDQFVRVTDPTRSVSKTHLEFGQDNGAFWVRDRYSGNGSMVREPERAPVRCEPGRRYLVPRGTRVDIADQFFVVS